jgi:hypothetical protein
VFLLIHVINSQLPAFLLVAVSKRWRHAMITLQEILNLRTNIFRENKTKIVRHAGGSERYRELTKEKHGLLNDQKNQDRDIFKNCKYVISFIGAERNRSIFTGVFKVNGVTKVKDKLCYDLEEVSDFDDLIDRIVVDWGSAAISWHQWYDAQSKEVIEMVPKGYLGSFIGLLDFVLDFDELKKLINNPEANTDWRLHLSCVNGIYMILDSNTGRQYIGSANGKNGIWQRWSEYASTKTGGNKELIKLLGSDPEYQRYFRYSVLQTLPSNITQKEIIRVENLYKEKFGSKVHGLNAN